MRNFSIVKPICILLMLLGYAAMASGQVARQGTVLSGSGRPVAGASIWVCTGNVTVTLTANPPCTPAQNIYTDYAQTHLVTQPLLTDGLGNYLYYTASGTVTEVVTGPNTLGYSAVLTLAPPNAAIKPAASDAWYYLSASGSDSNDCSLFSGCLTLAHILSLVPANTVAHIWVSPGSFSFSSTAQLPINTAAASCYIEGRGHGGDIGTTSLQDTGITVFTGAASFAGPILDQTVPTGASGAAEHQGCTIRNITFDMAAMPINSKSIQWGGLANFTLDGVHILNGSATGDFGVLIDNQFATENSERWDYTHMDCENTTNCYGFKEESGAGGSIGHGLFQGWFSLSGSQKAFSVLGGASVYSSTFDINGNFSSGAVLVSTDATSSFGNGTNFVIMHAECTTGSCTAFQSGGSSLANFTVTGFLQGGGSWTLGTGTFQFQGYNSLGATNSWQMANASLLSSGGGSITLQAPNTASNLTASLPILATNTSNCAVTGVTFANCSGFSFPVTSGAIYRGVCTFQGTSSVNATSAEAQWTIPGGYAQWFQSGTEQATTSMTIPLSFSDSTSTQQTTLSFVFIPNSSGTAQLQIADGTAGDVATLNAGSFCTVQ